ncbi:hypothetical protein A374_13770 [Fictibacillus macauensis ZFHKF-1]|uniref:Putative component of 'biosynthetic module' domain-containing protein n=1 Tax=Fictibacillus macauensis ZFHKF-1 TaxID=1196324 RepID=I8AH56_9BACL|nr:YceG family protein [Fictibacillus macauensis]EIT84764.1 hypothetical protein A374_13770 [Fictibacillus macauensis ZFHKF-1]
MGYEQIKPQLSPLNSEWFEQFQQITRPLASGQQAEQTHAFWTVAIRVLGVPLEEESYYNTLIDFKEDPTYHVLSEELDKHIEPPIFQQIQEVMNLHHQEPNGLSIKRLIAFMVGRRLLPQHSDPTLNRHLQQQLIEVMEFFQEKEQSGLLSTEFRRVVIDIIKWLKNHWEKWTVNMTVEDPFPKVIWYGPLKISHMYFLLLLMKLGCDVLIFHPDHQDDFARIDPTNRFSHKYEYGNKVALQPFPTTRQERRATVAYRASQQLEKLLHDQESGFYKPWQFREHQPLPLTMKMTYDDIFIYGVEEAMVRPDFQIEGRTVKLPVVFAKVHGVSHDREDYWDKMHSLEEQPLTVSIRRFPYAPAVKGNYRYHYEQALGNDGTLSVQKMMDSHWWQYDHLPKGLQFTLASAIKSYSEHPKLLKAQHEQTKDVQIFLFQQATFLPEELLRLLQQYDYPKSVPKVVLYHTEFNGGFTREDAALLLLLNTLGVDIIMYNPSGQSDIEHFIDSMHYDVHHLEDIVFEQLYVSSEQHKGSLIKRLVRKIF